MKIDIITLFPEMFEGPFDTSMLKKARDKGLVEINIHNLRNWAEDRHKTVDDRPYGGGVGMVLRVDVMDRAISEIKKQKAKNKKQRVILLSPQGKVFNQQKASELSKLNHLILIAGHYEGFDERIRKYLIDEEISIGDYILTGGELPAMVITDAVVRLIPGVLEKEAVKKESFSNYYTTVRGNYKSGGKIMLLDYPQYTRPAEYKGWKVPKILVSGNHKKIEAWRKKKALEITKKKRPDLLKKASSS